MYSNNEINFNPSLISCPTPSPVSIPFPSPIAGPQGPARSQGIIDVFCICENNPISPIVSRTLTLPPITLLSGQVIKLEAFASVLTDSAVIAILGIILRRNITTIVAKTNQSANEDTSVVNATLALNPSLAWLDSPPPDTYTYDLQIAGTFINVSNDNSLGDRVLIATIINM